MTATFEQPHYHIRWTRPPKFDWQPFSTPEEAKQAAEQLVLQGETYSIEKFGVECERCTALRSGNGQSNRPEVPSRSGEIHETEQI
jgi:hypothetical protein